jgi:hypothetical protein
MSRHKTKIFFLKTLIGVELLLKTMKIEGFRFIEVCYRIANIDMALIFVTYAKIGRRNLRSRNAKKAEGPRVFTS